MMSSEQQLIKIENILADHSTQLSKISEALSVMAVQQEQIITIQGNIAVLFKKMDEIQNPETGSIAKIKEKHFFHAQQCPKNQISLLWAITAPTALCLIGIALKYLGAI